MVRDCSITEFPYVEEQGCWGTSHILSSHLCFACSVILWPGPSQDGTEARVSINISQHTGTQILLEELPAPLSIPLYFLVSWSHKLIKKKKNELPKMLISPFHREHWLLHMIHWHLTPLTSPMLKIGHLREKKRSICPLLHCNEKPALHCNKLVIHYFLYPFPVFFLHRI